MADWELRIGDWELGIDILTSSFSPLSPLSSHLPKLPLFPPRYATQRRLVFNLDRKNLIPFADGINYLQILSLAESRVDSI